MSAPAPTEPVAAPGPAPAAWPGAPPAWPGAPPARLWRRLAAELVGTGLLLVAVVGSGIAASRLTPDDSGAQLAYHAAVVAAVLAVLIMLFASVSGAHFNPAVTLVAWFTGPGRRAGAATAGAYLAAQVAGAAGGALLANVMFELPAVVLSGTARAGAGQLLGEMLATGGLVLVVGGLSRAGRSGAIPLAVGAWIGAAIWFTASTSFANPAVTIGRMLTDSATGIAPASAPAFIAAQLLGAGLGAALVATLWPARQEPGA